MERGCRPQLEDEHGRNDVGRGGRVKPRRYSNRETEKILAFVTSRGPFRAVIEATGSYRWLYELLSPHGEVILAHPKRLAAIWSPRAKTDKIDAATLAELLRADMIPAAYVPPREYQELRDLTRERAKLVWGRTRAQSNVHAMLARDNIEPPFKKLFGPRGVAWLESLELGFGSGLMMDERLARIGHFAATTARLATGLPGWALAGGDSPVCTSIEGTDRHPLDGWPEFHVVIAYSRSSQTGIAWTQLPPENPIGLCATTTYVPSRFAPCYAA